MAMAATIKTIVITGGPCSGKTAALDWLRRDLKARGHTLIFVPEVASELITGGAAPWTCRSYDEFQKAVFAMQLSKEKVFLDAARRMDAEQIVMVLDRGLMDNGGYMSPACLEETLAENGLTRDDVFARYDVVFHLVSSAKGAREAYTLDNNATRRETPEEASAVDDRLLAAWNGHPHLHTIGNTAVFADKMGLLLHEVHAFLRTSLS